MKGLYENKTTGGDFFRMGSNGFNGRIGMDFRSVNCC